MSGYTMDSKYLKEAEELEKRWAKATNRSLLGDRYDRASVAVLLENQRLMNENPVNPEIGEFKRINIPLVRRITPQLVNPCYEIPLGPQEECVLPVPVKKRKKVLRSIDDSWES